MACIKHKYLGRPRKIGEIGIGTLTEVNAST